MLAGLRFKNPMVYGKEADGSGGFVVCILVGGMPVHERADGVVELPFETEYKIRLRNKTDKDAVAKIYIDDELITPTGLIVRKRNYYNSSDVVDLDCNVATRQKFKFVAVDSFDAIDHGKNRENDPAMGVIRVEFYSERDRPQVVHHYVETPPRLRRPIRPYGPFLCDATNSVSGSITARGDVTVSYSNASGAEMLTSKSLGAMPELEAGATVDGGQSYQNFSSAYVDIDWSKPPTVVRLVLKGRWRDEVQQAQPILSRNCSHCGAKRKRPSAKFCDMCGKSF